MTTAAVEKLGNLTKITSMADGREPYVWTQGYVNKLDRR